MPDLSGLVPQLTGLLVVQLLVGERDLRPKTRLYRRNFVRLVEKALREYQETREVILARIEKRGLDISLIFKFTDHIETCINAVSRLYMLLEKIKSKKESPGFPRELRRSVETQSESIKCTRNAVEHIDQLIHNDEISPGQPVMLAPNENWDGVIISKYEIKFNELAMVLKNMYEIAQYVLTLEKSNPQNQ